MTDHPEYETYCADRRPHGVKGEMAPIKETARAAVDRLWPLIIDNPEQVECPEDDQET